MTRAPFISFEGGEGTGKSTQVRLLSQALAHRNVPHIVTREPGGSPGAEQIRNLLVTGGADRWSPLSETLLFYAARVDHWHKVIRPALDDGKLVLCDRFADSTMAYQAYAGGMERDRIEQLHALVLGGVKPDLTIILDLDAASGLDRAQAPRPGSRARALPSTSACARAFSTSPGATRFAAGCSTPTDPSMRLPPTSCVSLMNA